MKTRHVKLLRSNQKSVADGKSILRSMTSDTSSTEAAARRYDQSGSGLVANRPSGLKISFGVGEYLPPETVAICCNGL